MGRRSRSRCQTSLRSSNVWRFNSLVQLLLRVTDRKRSVLLVALGRIIFGIVHSFELLRLDSRARRLHWITSLVHRATLNLRTTSAMVWLTLVLLLIALFLVAAAKFSSTTPRTARLLWNTAFVRVRIDTRSVLSQARGSIWVICDGRSSINCHTLTRALTLIFLWNLSWSSSHASNRRFISYHAPASDSPSRSSSSSSSRYASLWCKRSWLPRTIMCNTALFNTSSGWSLHIRRSCVRLGPRGTCGSSWRFTIEVVHFDDSLTTNFFLVLHPILLNLLQVGLEREKVSIPLTTIYLRS